VSVRISLDTVDRLEREVVEFFRSLSSKGSELGGLLLGTVQSGNPARVSIDSYELVACDYVRGPLYQLAEADTERLSRAVEQRNSSGGLRVVGFFRSHTRKGLGLDGEDIGFFNTHFRDPQQVALLIRPYASKPSTGGFFIRESGLLHGDASYLEFPFRRSELERMPQIETKPAPEKPAPEPAVSAEPPAPSKPAVRAQIVPIASRREISPSAERPAEPAPTPRFSEKSPYAEPAAAKNEPPASPYAKSPAPSYSKQAPPEPEKRETTDLADLVLPPLERPSRSHKMIWISGAAAIALLAASGALFYPGLLHKGKRVPVSAAQASAALSLRVERSASELVLSWNRDSDAIKNAARGSLAITDGDQHENVNLDLNQLKNGSIVYSPTGSDVSFQLSIIGSNSDQTSSESVRILKTRPSPMPDNPPAPQKASAAPPRTESSTTASEKEKAQPAPATPAVEPPTLVADAQTKSVPKLKQFHAESLSQRLRPATPADLPEAPGLTAVAAPPAIPVAVPGLNTAPALPTALPRPSAPTAASPKSGGQLQQAQLISSKAPDYPLVAKQAHVQGVVVVSAVVGVDGRVKSASAVSGPPLLQKSAVDAVRQWTYKPTMLNGAPVESETRVEVRFTGTR
jgi:protein TonB